VRRVFASTQVDAGGVEQLVVHVAVAPPAGAGAGAAASAATGSAGSVDECEPPPKIRVHPARRSTAHAHAGKTTRMGDRDRKVRADLARGDSEKIGALRATSDPNAPTQNTRPHIVTSDRRPVQIRTSPSQAPRMARPDHCFGRSPCFVHGAPRDSSFSRLWPRASPAPVRLRRRPPPPRVTARMQRARRPRPRPARMRPNRRRRSSRAPRTQARRQAIRAAPQRRRAA
jgi:hypothetical protein